VKDDKCGFDLLVVFQTSMVFTSELCIFYLINISLHYLSQLGFERNITLRYDTGMIRVK